MRRLGRLALVAALFLSFSDALAQSRAQEVEAIEEGEVAPITDREALEMPEDPDDADDIRDDNDPDDVGQEALGDEVEESP